jgi:hypothetical protein
MPNEDLEKTVADLVEKKFREKEATGRREQTIGNNDPSMGNDDPSARKKRQLIDLVNLLKDPPKPFEHGQVVTWKPGLKNKKYPKEGQPAVVIKQLPAPIIQGERDSGSPYFQEPLDLVLGVLDDDGDLMVFHYDKRRFELAT